MTDHWRKIIKGLQREWDRSWPLALSMGALLFLILLTLLQTEKVMGAEPASAIKSRLQKEKRPQERQKLFEALSRRPASETKGFLKDKDSKVRAAAALSAARDGQAPLPEDDLVTLAQEDPDPATRSAALLALGQRRARFGEVRQVLNDPAQPLLARQSAASALALFPQPEAVQALGQAYGASEGELKEHIKICLEGLRGRHPELVDAALKEKE